MPDAVIFVFGSIVFLMVLFGLVFTVTEFRRLNREAVTRQVIRARAKLAG